MTMRLHDYPDYRWLRGFNIIPSWGARIEQAWWEYDGGRFREKAALRAVSFASLNGRGEHFSGVISRQADGVVRCSGAIPSDQACNIIRIEGLESIRRFTAPELNVTQEALVKADQDNTRRALAAARPPEPYTIAVAQKDAQGQVDWKSVKGLRISNEGQTVTAEFRAAYDNDNLYVSYTVNDPTPWKNSGNEFRLLFKTGDCVDFQLSPSGNKTAKAAAGDLRVLMANFNGKPVAVLLKPVAPGAPVADRFTFSSTVITVTFDQVKLLSEVTPTVAVRGNGYTVTAGAAVGAPGRRAQGGTEAARRCRLHPLRPIRDDQRRARLLVEQEHRPGHGSARRGAAQPAGLRRVYPGPAVAPPGAPPHGRLTACMFCTGTAGTAADTLPPSSGATSGGWTRWSEARNNERIHHDEP